MPSDSPFKQHIRTIPGFPKPGIRFRDITTLLSQPEIFSKVIDALAERYQNQTIHAIAGLEARGFIIGAALSHHLGIAFVPVRKKGKLPADTFSAQYQKEYGPDELEIHKDALKKDQRVLIVDDLIATGGTAAAAIELMEQAGADIVEVACLIELVDLNGREKLSTPLYSIMTFTESE